MAGICGVNIDPRSIVAHGVPTGLKIVTDMQYVGEVGKFKPPADAAISNRIAIGKLSSAKVKWNRTCNAAAAFVSHCRGRFPQEGLPAVAFKPDMLAPAYRYASETDAQSVVWSDMRQPLLLDRLETRVTLVEGIVAAYTEQVSGILLDGCFNDKVTGGRVPVAWASFCDLFARLKTKLRTRPVWINCAGTLQWWEDREIGMVANAGVAGITFEQAFIDRSDPAQPDRNVPRRDYAQWKKLCGNIKNLTGRGVQVVLIKTADPYDPNHAIDMQFAAESTDAWINTTI